MALYNRYRPARFSEIVGQDHITITLRNEAKRGMVSNAYLFFGPRGTGKTTMARIFAQAISCSSTEKEPCGKCQTCLEFERKETLDLIEIDAASNTGVDIIRSTIIDNVHFQPNTAAYKVYIIDEVHMLSKNAFNALLKTLEEPPSHAVFILVTTERDKLLPTILSRCQQHSFRRIPFRLVADHLEFICRWEGINARRGALEIMAQMSEGCMRDGISILDQLSVMGEEITPVMARDMMGWGNEMMVFNLVHHISDGDLGQCINDVYNALQAGVDLKMYIKQTVEALHLVLRHNLGARLDLMSDSTIDSITATSMSNIRIAEVITALTETVNGTTFAHFDQMMLINVALASVMERGEERPIAKNAPVVVAYDPMQNEAVAALVKLGGTIIKQEDF